MSIQRIFIGLAVVLFLGIGVAALVKNRAAPNTEVASVLEEEESSSDIVHVSENENSVDNIEKFFSKGVGKFPIVETVTYTSRVNWLKGRPAWIADYAHHYQTSRHFIARGLNERRDYFTQMISPGDMFNVYRTDKKFKFYLLVDLKSCTMDFYYLDYDTDERVFIKTYQIGVGRHDPLSPSGSLTPIGKYKLGSKVGIYKEGVEHYFQNQKREMIEVFGTRWIPLEQEVENCPDYSTGYGIQGVPCKFNKEKGVLVEAENGVGTHETDGCIRLSKNDVEEIFAIVITKPTIVEIVKTKSDVVLPMSKEVNE